MNKRKDFWKHIPTTFDSPDQLPENEAEAADWQRANNAFWDENPMRYDWTDAIGFKDGEEGFFEEIDRRFFEEVHMVMPWKNLPFDNLIPFDELPNMRVLEIGVGMGSHAALIARHAQSFGGIDLTDYAVDMTTKRMEILGVQEKSEIRRMDAEQISFPDASFDFVWSWGVIHHSSNTKNVLQEIHRVLKPAGRTVIMVYHKGWWNYYTVGVLIQGIVRGGFFKHGSLARIIQANTDGAIARYYTKDSFAAITGDKFALECVHVIGNKSDVLPMPGGRLKEAIKRFLPDALVRFMLSNLKMGTMIIFELKKVG